MIKQLYERNLKNLIKAANEKSLTKDEIIGILPPTEYGDYVLIYQEKI